MNNGGDLVAQDNRTMGKIISTIGQHLGLSPELYAHHDHCIHVWLGKHLGLSSKLYAHHDHCIHVWLGKHLGLSSKLFAPLHTIVFMHEWLGKHLGLSPKL